MFKLFKRNTVPFIIIIATVLAGSFINTNFINANPNNLNHTANTNCLSAPNNGCTSQPSNHNFSSNIIDIYQIQEISKHLTHKNCLVIFDIDNTLLFPKTDLGSDQWFSHMVEAQTKLGADINTAIKTVLPLYFHVHDNIELIPTEPELNHKLKHIHNHCHHAIFLTARSLPLVPATMNQLAKNNLNFPANPYAHQFANEHTFDLAHPHMYKNNALFCGLNDKGAVLLAYLDHINYKPDLIIFIDDKAKNISSVAIVANQRGINFVGLRYAGCDQRVQDFNHELVQQELQEFLIQFPYQGPADNTSTLTN